MPLKHKTNSMKSNSKTETILMVMNVLAWIAFIGLMVKAGTLLVSYGISAAYPEVTKNMYKGLNWYSLRQYDFWLYTGIVSMLAAIFILQAYVAYLVIKVLSRIKMASPFTGDIAKRLENIAYTLILIWVASVIYNGQLKWISKQAAGVLENTISDDFIIYAGLVYLIAQIFKKGVEIQSENELTV